MTPIRPRSSDDLGVILVAGADARIFLQGQLTADVDALSQQDVLLAACNSPQGRVQSIVWLLERNEGIALIVDRAAIEMTLARLRRYVLRAKVSLDTACLGVGLVRREESSVASAAASDVRFHSQLDGTSVVTLPGHRHAWVVAPPEGMLAARPEEGLAWRLDHLRAGLPRVHPETHERFVAQMLNLDLLGGISFEKGCYTGQEIIARTHFRGAVKRRMFRYRAACPPPPPATRLLFETQHAGDIVESVPTDGGCELLAVVNLANADAALELAGTEGTTLDRLSLPYDVM